MTFKSPTLRIAVALVGATALIALAVLMIQPETSFAAEVNRSLDKIMQSIDRRSNGDWMMNLSSNPYDYIVRNPYYEQILAMGYDALPSSRRKCASLGQLVCAP